MLKITIALTLLASQAHAFGDMNQPGVGLGDTVAVSTLNVSQNGAVPLDYSNAPISAVCNINGFCQFVLQNLSNGNNASGDYVVTNDLGSNTSFYLDIGINSSKYSQAGFTGQVSSEGFIGSSDSGLDIGADILGATNGGGGDLKLMTGGANIANVRMFVQNNGAITIPVGSTLTVLGADGSGFSADFEGSVNADGGILVSTEVVTSTLTVLGNAFSVGGSTFVVSNSSVEIGGSDFACTTCTLQVVGAVSVTGNLAAATFKSGSTAGISYGTCTNQMVRGAKSISGIATGGVCSAVIYDMVTSAVIASSLTVNTQNIYGSSTPAASFLPNLSSGTTPSTLSGTFANTALGPCIASSTQTINLPVAETVLVNLHCTISVASLAAVIGAGYLMDGLYQDGETSAKGIVAPLEAVSTDGTNVSFVSILFGVAAGSHSFCFAPFVSANTGTIDSTNSICRLSVNMLP